MLKKLEDVREDYNFLMDYTVGKKQEWWYGIEGIYFIWMGAWNDALIGYKGYAFNVHEVKDCMWERLMEEFTEGDMEDFPQYMLDHKDEVFMLLDDVIAQEGLDTEEEAA